MTGSEDQVPTRGYLLETLPRCAFPCGHHTSWQNVQAAVDERMPPRHWRPQRAATWSLLNEVPSSVLGHSTFKVRPHRSAGSGRHGLGRVCGTRKASGHAGANCRGSAASSAPTPAQTQWFELSNGAWAAIRKFILTDIPAILPESGYIGGAVPGEDDFHLAAWLARIALLTGATPAEDGVLSLKKELGGEDVPPKVVAYWKLWSATDAWKKVYENGLH